MLARAHVLCQGQDYTARAIVAPEDVSAGARMYGYFTARAKLVHKSGAPREENCRSAAWAARESMIVTKVRCYAEYPFGSRAPRP
jgi:hypothetical protein